MVDGGEHRPLVGEFHHRLGGVDVYVHQMEGQVDVEDAAGELPLELPVGVGLLQGGGEEGGFDGAAAAEEGLEGPGAPACQRLGDIAPDADALAAAVYLGEVKGKVPAPGGVDGGEELPVAGSKQLLLPVPQVADGHLRVAEGHLLEDAAHGGGLGAVFLHEFQPGGGVVEEVTDDHSGALGTAGGLHHAGNAALQGEGCAAHRAFGPGEHIQAADGGDGGQSFTPEAQGADGGQVLGGAQLAGGMAQEGGGQLLGRNAAAVVGDPDGGHAAVLDLHGDGGGSCIDGVFQKLLDHAGGTLHHLAGGDQVRHMGGQLLNVRHRRLLSVLPVPTGGGASEGAGSGPPLCGFPHPRAGYFSLAGKVPKRAPGRPRTPLLFSNQSGVDLRPGCR